MPQQKGFKRASKVLKRQKKTAVRTKLANIRKTERQAESAGREDKADK